MVVAEGTDTELQRELTPAEARLEARKQKILQNREGRFQKILGPNSELAAKRIVNASAQAPAEDPVLPEEFLTLDFLQKAKNQQQSSATLGSSTNTYPSSNFGPAPARINTVHPQPVWKNHQIYISILGAFLSFSGLNYFLLYFLLFETGVLVYFRQVPLPPIPPNMIFTLFALMGLKEQDVNRIKLAMRISIWIFKDLAFFIFSSIIPQLLLDLLKSV